MTQILEREEKEKSSDDIWPSYDKNELLEIRHSLNIDVLADFVSELFRVHGRQCDPKRAKEGLSRLRYNTQEKIFHIR